MLEVLKTWTAYERIPQAMLLWTTGSKDIEAGMLKTIENYIMVHKF